MTSTTWTTNYFHNTELLWCDDDPGAEILIGDGVMLPGTGTRKFRVVDVWHSHTGAGSLELGTNIFLEDVSDPHAPERSTATPYYAGI